MSTAPAQSASTKPQSSGGNTLRIILFVILGYMLVALAYDYMYVFKAHEEKTKAVQELVDKENTRPIEERLKNGPIGPKEVLEVMGFAPTVVADDENLLHERYTYHRGVPVMVREIDVFYTGPKEARAIVSVANNAEDREIAKPTAGSTPPTPEELNKAATAEGGEKTETPSNEKPADEKPADEKPADEKPTEEPAAPPAGDAAKPE